MGTARINAVKGMNDILPEDSPLWHHLESTARRVLSLYGYGEIRTPIAESTALFVRGIGEETDVVGKEMYTFNDRGGDSLSLRPEGTAGAARAYVEHSRHAVDPIQKWFYVGPMFRGEQPQKGRSRQFHQLGVELFGVSDASADVEMIALLHRYLTELDVPNVVLRLNSLGDENSRPAYREALVSHFSPHRSSLSETDQRRLDTNPLRLLDSKDPAAVEIAASAPSTLDYLDAESERHFKRVTDTLTAIGVPFEIDPRIVRGLDYYTRTTFEFVAKRGLGSQSTLAGGGRYDRLVEALGGPATPAIGFGLGLERLAILLEKRKPASVRGPDLFIGVLGDSPAKQAAVIAEACRNAGVRVELTLKPTGVAKQFKRADRLGATFAAVIGDGELESGNVRVKQLATGEETEVPLNALADKIVEYVEQRTPASEEEHS